MSEFDDLEGLTHLDPLPTSELCVRCGVCCVVLNAYCSEEEATEVCEHGGVAKERFVKSVDERGALMRFPCTFLRGRVMSHVACAVYGGPRPEVCGSYLCKIAINYATRRISLEDAIHALNVSFLGGDFSIFNWSGDPRDLSVYLRGRISKESARLRAEGTDQAIIDYRASASVTPKYVIPTEIDHDLLSMHFFSHDHRMWALSQMEGASRRDVMRQGLRLYLEDEIVDALPDAAVDVAATTMSAVLTELRAFFASPRDEDFRSRCGLPPAVVEEATESQEEGAVGLEEASKASRVRATVDEEAAERLRQELVQDR